MTINDFIIILLSILIVILINILLNRCKTYRVFVKNIETGVIFTLIVKSLSKRKVYETVSEYLIKEGIPYVINNIANTAFIDNNSILCSNIYINKK